MNALQRCFRFLAGVRIAIYIIIDNRTNLFAHIISPYSSPGISGAPNEKIVQNPCNIAFLNVF